MHVDALDEQEAAALQLPDGSGVVSQCRSPSLSLIQPHRPSSKEQLRYPDAGENGNRTGAEHIPEISAYGEAHSVTNRDKSANVCHYFNKLHREMIKRA